MAASPCRLQHELQCRLGSIPSLIGLPWCSYLHLKRQRLACLILLQLARKSAACTLDMCMRHVAMRNCKSPYRTLKADNVEKEGNTFRRLQNQMCQSAECGTKLD